MSVTYRPTGETALIITPPLDICAYADYYRSRYMPDMLHAIEPHITVTVPFVPYEQLAGAEPKLREALAACPPRRLSLRGFGVFREEGVLYLGLADNERVYSLHRAVIEAFPEYPVYGGRYGDDWIPHMTVGIFADPTELDRVFDELLVQKLYIGFDVESIAVKYKNDDGMWDTWAELPLGR
jgi:2'-5' RNA ligase